MSLKKISTNLIFVCRKCGTPSIHKKITRRENSTYGLYHGMKSRCLNKNNRAYKNYGGRGIKICKRWLESFDNFYADMGEAPSKNFTLDRINNNGNYTPSNCRWASKTDQNNNTRNVRYFKYQGQRLTTRQWSIKTGIPKTCIDERLNLGWPLSKILTTPSIIGRNQYGDNGIQYTCFGKTQSLQEWSNETGISLHALRKRINTYKWSIERSLKEPARENKIYLKEFLNISDLTFEKIKNRLKKSGIKYSTFSKRIIKYGWSLKKALSKT